VTAFCISTRRRHTARQLLSGFMFNRTTAVLAAFI